jgi:hypothetical protein
MGTSFIYKLNNGCTVATADCHCTLIREMVMISLLDACVTTHVDMRQRCSGVDRDNVECTVFLYKKWNWSTQKRYQRAENPPHVIILRAKEWHQEEWQDKSWLSLVYVFSTGCICHRLPFRPQNTTWIVLFYTGVLFSWLYGVEKCTSFSTLNG